ncbi:unnamed protein product [Moneuplotes crassus]|uniref:Uncharacterized protein n=1 Tax=Euplotes crassus TaxID=5936 RepID=A0AAD1Y243_EUPCR|nr:unnamed protein product [Moneuplotes crassus]
MGFSGRRKFSEELVVWMCVVLDLGEMVGNMCRSMGFGLNRKLNGFRINWVKNLRASFLKILKIKN